MVGPIVQRIEFATGEARRCNDQVVITDAGLDRPQRIASRRDGFERRQQTGFGWRTLRRGRQVGRRDTALSHDECVRRGTRCHVAHRPVECRIDIGLVVGEPRPRDLHQLEQLRRDRTHQLVLRLVARTVGVAPQRGDQENRNPERMVERRQWADGIAETRVLEHRYRAQPAYLSAGGDRNGVSFVRGTDVSDALGADRVVDERLQVGTGYAAIKAKAALTGRLDEAGRRDHAKRPAATTSSSLSTSSQFPVVYVTRTSWPPSTSAAKR